MSRILLVDDDTDFTQAMSTLLRAKGHEVSTAVNGAEGYEKAVAEKPELMLLDVMMTTENEGFDVARKLHENPATNSIPVVIISGIRKTKNLPFAYEPDDDWLPVKAVLDKPITPDLLLRTVDNALRK